MPRETDPAYSTQPLTMEPAVFESMVNNMGNRVRRIRLNISFKSETDKANFVRAVERNELREIEDDLSDIEEEEDKSTVVSSAHKKEEDVGEGNLIELKETFEMSILLKEHFMPRLTEIGLKYGVKFMVVPSKVKIAGNFRDSLEDALDEYRIFQENLYFQDIGKDGKAIYDSHYYKQKLRENNINVVNILKNYYFWFEKDRTDPSVLREVLGNMKHAIFELSGASSQNLIRSGRVKVIHGKGKEKFFGQVETTQQLYTEVRARLFEQVLSENLNKDRLDDNPQFELSEDRIHLIMHLSMNEQYDIQRKRIEELYEPYKYIYMRFAEETDIEKIEEILKKGSPQISFKKNKTNEPQPLTFLWEKHGLLFLIAYLQPSKQLTEAEVKEHILYRLCNEFPKELLNFKLGVKIRELPEEEWSDRYNIEKNFQDNMNYVGCKNQTKTRYLDMISRYLMNEFTEEFVSRIKEKKKTVDEASISMDMTHKINETSILNEHSQSRILKDVVEEEAKKVVSISGEIQKANFKFENYQFHIPETIEERESKFVEESTFTKGKVMYNKLFEEKMFSVTGHRYKFYKAKLPLSSKVDLGKLAQTLAYKEPEHEHLNKWVTVWARDVDKVMVESVGMGRVEKYHSLKEGWLVQTNLLFLFLDEGELPVGRYEVLAFAKRVS